MVKVTGQGSLHTATNKFRDDISCFDQSIILKLHTCITYHSGKIPINFTLKISKVKVTGEHCLQICFRIITPVRINNCFQTLPFYHPSPITHERSLLILGSKSRSQVRAFPPQQINSQVITSAWIDQFHSGSTYVSLITQGRSLLIFWGQLVYGQGHRSG